MEKEFHVNKSWELCREMKLNRNMCLILSLLHSTWNTVAWCLYLKKSDHRQMTSTVRSRYISGEKTKSRESFKATWRWNWTTSISGPSKTDYFCVIYKRKIYLFYNWTRSYLVMMDLWPTVSGSRSCSFQDWGSQAQVLPKPW